ncbi:uncharacterized protein CDAR_101681 [Caerostris darwini]|uniref:Ig-like domain-containing protein n=1 Tax=Caerostris darwini TaxID=1538125 RepID=A0AAV4QTA6_9ARAC|nr:uncharacterized protein CDAR_101681 [Caerostris darwini]
MFQKRNEQNLSSLLHGLSFKRLLSKFPPTFVCTEGLMRGELFILLILPPMIACLKISSFEVPSLLVPGDSAYLTCLFDLAGEKLYSVKWYKDEQEFYRFFPSLTPQYMAFRAPGIHVDDQYKQVLQNRFQLQLKEWLPHGEFHIFKQGGALFILKKHFYNNIMSLYNLVLDISPDKNPTENAWEFVKRKLTN